MILFWALANATAGTLPEGTHHIFSGVSYGTWSSFESKGSEKSLPQSAKVTQVLSQTQYTYGLKDGMDISIFVPVSNVSASGVSGNMFDPTTGIGQLGVSSNLAVWNNDSIDLISRLGVSTGALHAANRGRVTNIGDGSTQLHLGLAGSGLWDVSSGYVHVNARGGYIAKIPSTFDFDPKYPADDLTYGFSIGGGFKGYNLNLFMDGFYRLDGVDHPASPDDVPAIEAFTALKASQMKVGINDSISFGDWTVSGYIATSVFAKNNPTDEMIGGVGVGYLIQP